ncbi:MAG: tryptophan-rich sensory protein [Legionellaceae bacterium]|nr:tryptophan-rich sensory protein [Legionellaceae bacterium]
MKKNDGSQARTKYFYFFICIVAFQAIGYVMGLITKANIDPWYHNLIKSSLTPPDIYFGIVWTVLYILLAIIGVNIFTTEGHSKILQRTTYSSQMVLNWLWSPVFFSFHWVGVGFTIIILMTILTTVLIYSLYNGNKKMAFLLLPYLLWILFATYLNGFIWIYA